MILYRISGRKFAHDTSGTGAKLFGGRWNSVGIHMHYMASSRALAALEVLVNKGTMGTGNFCLTTFEVPENSIQTISLAQLPRNWKKYPAPAKLQQIGDQFVKEGKFLLLKVPSAIITDEYNFLMNCNHHLADQIKVIDVKRFSFDDRLN